MRGLSWEEEIELFIKGLTLKRIATEINERIEDLRNAADYGDEINQRIARVEVTPDELSLEGLKDDLLSSAPTIFVELIQLKSTPTDLEEYTQKILEVCYKACIEETARAYLNDVIGKTYFEVGDIYDSVYEELEEELKEGEPNA